MKKRGIGEKSHFKPNFFLSHIEKNIFFCEHKVYKLKGFKSHIEKIIFFFVNIEYIFKEFQIPH